MVRKVEFELMPCSRCRVLPDMFEVIYEESNKRQFRLECLSCHTIVQNDLLSNDYLSLYDVGVSIADWNCLQRGREVTNAGEN